MCQPTAPAVQIPKDLLASTVNLFFQDLGPTNNTVVTSAGLLSNTQEEAKAKVDQAEESIRNITQISSDTYKNINKLIAAYPSLNEPGFTQLVSACTAAANYCIGKIGELNAEVELLRSKLKEAIEMGTTALSDDLSYVVRNAPDEITSLDLLVSVFKEAHPIAEAQMKEDLRTKVDPKPFIKALMEAVEANVNLENINAISDTMVPPNLNLDLSQWKC